MIIDGESVEFVDPDSDGVQQAIADIEEEQINEGLWTGRTVLRLSHSLSLPSA